MKKLALIIAHLLSLYAGHAQQVDCASIVDVSFDKYDSIYSVYTKKAFLYTSDSKFYLRFMVQTDGKLSKSYFISELPTEFYASPTAMVYFETSQGTIIKLASKISLDMSNNMNLFEISANQLKSLLNKDSFPIKSVALTHLTGRIESTDVNLLNYYLKNYADCSIKRIEEFFNEDSTK